MAAQCAMRAHSAAGCAGAGKPVSCSKPMTRPLMVAKPCQHWDTAVKTSRHVPFQGVARPGAHTCSALRLMMVHAAAGAQEAATEDAASLLSELLSWCLANGVKGIGTQGSKLALYEAQGGERGMLCIQDMEAGEEVLRIPLTLALTDHPGDEESNALLYEGAPWSVRLSAKLLRQKAKGTSSSWYPHIQTLPKQVPAPLSVMSWEEMQAIEVPAAKAALYEHDWLIADSYKRCSDEALAGASEEDFKWAMSIVHSRTFGTAAKKGGVGVRMLLPLVDMFNHGGDEAALPSQQAPAPAAAADEVFAADNVRWDLVPPPASPEAAAGGGSWVMSVSATYLVGREEALLLSYGERPNLDFFLHYGFVPCCNPHEAVVLFEGLEDALEWHAQRYRGVQSLGDLDVQAQELYAKALQAGQQEQEQQRQQELQQLEQQQRQQQEREIAIGTPSISGRSVEEAGDKTRVELLRGGRIGAPLVAAFAALHGGEARPAEAAALAAITARCWQLLGSFTPLLADLAALVLDTVARGDGEQEGYYAMLLQHYWQVIMPKYEPPATHTASTSSTPGVSPSSSDLAQALLQHYERSDDLVLLASGRPLSSGLRLAFSYRAEQKMVLWGAVLASGARLEVLQGREAEASAIS